MLQIWQIQRLAGVPVQDRRIPSPEPDGFARDVEIIRKLLERKL